jgi:hypothetical protein
VDLQELSVGVTSVGDTSTLHPKFIYKLFLNFLTLSLLVIWLLEHVQLCNDMTGSSYDATGTGLIELHVVIVQHTNMVQYEVM